MELTLVENLQEQVEHALVSLLDLVEQYDGVGVLADLVHQEATLLVTDVSRRRSVEQSHRVLLLELRHVEADQRTLVTEEERSQRLGQLRLTGTGRTEEEERTHRLTLLAQT